MKFSSDSTNEYEIQQESELYVAIAQSYLGMVHEKTARQEIQNSQRHRAIKEADNQRLKMTGA